MATNIPDEQLRFSQLAVKQGWIRPEQARAAMDLYLRHQSRGGEPPSIARILINQGLLGRKQGEQILRHIYKNEPLPPPTVLDLSAVKDGQRESLPQPPTRAPNLSPFGVPAITASSAFSSGPGKPLPPAPAVPARKPPEQDSESAILQGMGALVLSRELQELKGYKIDSVVGEGSMGIVYKALQVSMDREVALKVLPPDKTRDAKFVEEFLAEARNAGRLNHPNLIRVHEVGKSGNLFYYSMEYIEGMRLDELMDEHDNGKLEPKQATAIFSQVASALDYGQRSGIVHREIRPNAVMLTSEGHAKLSDLGLVKDEETRFLTGENAYYVSPEQAQGLPADTRSDIYSLGCCFYQALTGERPFDQGGPPRETLLLRLTAPVPNPLSQNPKLPQDLSRVVMKMLQRDPAQRYQTPGEVVEALKKVNFFAPQLAPPKSSSRMRRKFGK